MEFTEEIKSKVFAQYLGQRFTYKWVNTLYDERLSVKGLDIINSLYVSDVKLILKPLSAITKEDACNLLGGTFTKYLGYNKENKCVDFHIRTTNPDNSYKDDAEVCINLDYDMTLYHSQYLISKGYDLPQYLLDGKTLQESGLAIYEN